MRFRTGKYKGLTLDEVRTRDPRYIQWVRENRPEMLRARPVAKPVRKRKVRINPPDIPRADQIPPGRVEDAWDLD